MDAILEHLKTGTPLLLSADNYTHQMWGGDWIPRMKGLPVPTRPVGESWELSCREERPSKVEWPDGSAISLPGLVNKYPREIMGRSAGAEGRFPLLLKFIDSRDDLSVQVHPSDEAAAIEHDSGKSEAWLILDSGTGTDEGFVYAGFNPEKAAGYASEDDFREAFLTAINQANGQGPSDDPSVRSKAERLVLPFLNRIRVQAGDVIRLDPGTIHAIGRGVRLFEIQQNSDLTYRVWDWNRPDADRRKEGKLVFRTLHLDLARKALDFHAQGADAYRVIASSGANGERLLVREPEGRFALSRAELKKGDSRHWQTQGKFFAVTVLSGRIELGYRRPLVLEAGRSALVPAIADAVPLTAVSDAVVLKSFVP